MTRKKWVVLPTVCVQKLQLGQLQRLSWFLIYTFYMIHLNKKNGLQMTPTEQGYLKQIYLHASGKGDIMHTKQLAELVKVKSASVTDIVKRLAKKKLLIYNRYYGCSLSKSGKKEAIQVIRRHRMWKLFLAEKLGIDWKDIYQIAAQLQSIQSDVLIEKLSCYLGHPALDSHGEPIPDKNGKFRGIISLEIGGLKTNQPAIAFGYRDTGKEFL